MALFRVVVKRWNKKGVANIFTFRGADADEAKEKAYEAMPWSQLDDVSAFPFSLDQKDITVHTQICTHCSLMYSVPEAQLRMNKCLCDGPIEPGVI